MGFDSLLLFFKVYLFTGLQSFHQAPIQTQFGFSLLKKKKKVSNFTGGRTQEPIKEKLTSIITKQKLSGRNEWMSQQGKLRKGFHVRTHLICLSFPQCWCRLRGKKENWRMIEVKNNRPEGIVWITCTIWKSPFLEDPCVWDTGYLGNMTHSLL